MSGYGASKRVCEIVMHKHRCNNLKIVRPGTIAFSGHGCLSPNDTIAKFIQSILQMKVIPDIEDPIHLVAVEDCAAVVEMFLRDESEMLSVNTFGHSTMRVSDIGEDFVQRFCQPHYESRKCGRM